MDRSLGSVGLALGIVAVAAVAVLWRPGLVAPDFQQSAWALVVLAGAPVLGLAGCGLGVAGRASPPGKAGVAVGLLALAGWAAFVLANCGGWGR